MARISVLGGTGYAGGHVVAEAARRGHQVTSYSRHAPAAPVDGVTYATLSALDPAFVPTALADADVVLSSLAPRGELEGRVRSVVAALAAAAPEAGVRLGVIGGAGSLQVAPDGPLLVTTPDFPEAFRAEALEAAGVLEDLRATPAELDWFYVSPAAGFGSYAPGEATGRYRVGGDVLLVDADGRSAISGADLALAIVDEIENPAHRRVRFTAAY
ncbi:NAD(P)-dependent oxidoreductase [Litorihabitans aurantiacus]|uniref:NAD-dependent epimerase n=1 Tax=Litorihabitans aurantiacus TaxID=1930061 RepID=A0AA37XGS1_9MICO|nr:NAD(P)H-binding protein [Litorihabitans aurantiacus]GMA32909.1 NAD-dependent epimerase [Litorihabitans aurantiacus]